MNDRRAEVSELDDSINECMARVMRMRLLRDNSPPATDQRVFPPAPTLPTNSTQQSSNKIYKIREVRHVSVSVQGCEIFIKQFGLTPHDGIPNVICLMPEQIDALVEWLVEAKTNVNGPAQPNIIGEL